jgi:hypothetical protein
LLNVPRVNKTVGSRAFRSFGPLVWNSLPLSIRTCPTSVPFLSKLRLFVSDID